MRVSIRVPNLLLVLLTTMSLSACLPGDDDGAAQAGLAINFTNPAGASKIETPNIVVNITGTVTSETEVDIVEWQNDRGGKGNANGKSNWVTGNIVLQPGINNIQITAHTVEGESISDVLTVERSAAKPGNGDADDSSVTTLTWAAPTTRDDQSALTNLAGYYVYYGQRSGEYVQKIAVSDPSTTSHLIRDLSPGTWYFAVSAYDDNGFESHPSSEISRTL